MRDFKELEFEFRKWRQTINDFNRFDNRNGLLDMLCECFEGLKCNIRKGEIFYRGRIFNLDDVVSNRKQYREWVNSNDAVFQGYDAKESGAPPAKYAREGRLNGNGIAFLYTCDNIDTVVYELRPTLAEVISIGEFVTNRELVFADLTEDRARKINGDCFSDLIMLIAEEFSVPHFAGHNYAFTQYLAGQFMNQDFDGVIFESSLDPNGKNFVFFYPRDCEALSSRLYKVTEISISHDGITRREV